MNTETHADHDHVSPAEAELANRAPGNALTVGLSPKVITPAMVQAAVGVILVIVGIIASNDDVLALGAAALTGSGVTLGVGYHSRPGYVIPAGRQEDDAA